jgi:spermidine/putrescine transport system ATP-binding protein
MKTKSIRLEHVSKRFADAAVFEDLNLTIPGGKFFAILGPSGSGKTTLLRLIAGFETVDSGNIYLGEQNITHMPINERRVNTVFQNYALFPHLNVFDNVAYGLRVKGVAQEIIEERVAQTLRMVHLEKIMYRSIAQLSGGQQQRIALARAVINEPDVLLLDEPLAALDMKLRERMLVELIELQEQLGATFVYITHDQVEALTVADSMAIMNYDGEIEQVGTPKGIYEFPTSSFVAKFVGSTNMFKGIVDIGSEGTAITIDGLGKFLTTPQPDKYWIYDGALVLMSLRPEKIEISKQSKTGFANHVRGTVRTIMYNGSYTRYMVQVEGGALVHVFEQNEEHFPQEVIDYDDVVHLYWQKENVVLLER